MRIALALLSILVLTGCIDDGRGGFGSGSGSSRPVTQSAAREDPPLRIVEARYGTDRRTCDATRAVRRACEGESDCSLKAGNELCGDPTPGRVKQLTVTFSCHGQVRTTDRPEPGILGLRC